MAPETAMRPTADRFINTTLDLIAERGGSLGVNLREIARRMGCAHTNAYNYFGSFDDLLWAAFRRALKRYGEYLVADLDDSLERDEYLQRLVTNLATFPQEHPGVYRFVASDPIDLAVIPTDILETASEMKQWLFEVLETVYAPTMAPGEAERISNIVLAYIDGETLNLINGRVVPGEDIGGRVVENSLRMIEALGTAAPDTPFAGARRATSAYPVLDLSTVEKER